MKSTGVISTAVLLWLLGTNAPGYAQQQQDQQDKDKQRQQQDQSRQRDQDREQQRAQQQQDQNRQRDQNREQQRAQQQQDQARQRDQIREQQRAQQQQEQNAEQRGQKQRQQDVNEASRPDHQREVEQRDTWQQHRARTWHSEHRTWQDRGGYSGYRIPDDRFRDNFGENHLFRVYSRPVVVVGGYPRFQYGGYWFSVVDPWPEYWPDDWYDNHDVYIDYLDDGYYLCNRRFPGDRIALIVYLN